MVTIRSIAGITNLIPGIPLRTINNQITNRVEDINHLLFMSLWASNIFRIVWKQAHIIIPECYNKEYFSKCFTNSIILAEDKKRLPGGKNLVRNKINVQYTGKGQWITEDILKTLNA